MPELVHQIAPAAGALNGLARLGEDAFNLFVQLVAVRDDDYAGVGIVLQYPLGQHHHDDAFAAALGVPDDAALAFLHMLLRCFDAEILVHARQLLPAAIEEHEVVYQFKQPLLGAHFEQVFVQLEAGVVLLIFLPAQEILFLGAYGPVLQALRIVTGKKELHGAEKRRMKFRLLA